MNRRDIWFAVGVVVIAVAVAGITSLFPVAMNALTYRPPSNIPLWASVMIPMVIIIVIVAAFLCRANGGDLR